MLLLYSVNLVRRDPRRGYSLSSVRLLFTYAVQSPMVPFRYTMQSW